MSWIEVESKIYIRDVKELRAKIKKIATFIGTKKKIDRYFKIVRGYPNKAFRIRAEKGNYLVNFKKWRKEFWDRYVVAKEEFEFAIDKHQLYNFLEMFKDMGVQEWVSKDKISENYAYKKNKKLTLEINNVSKLGYFLEIEYLCQDKYVNKAKKLIKHVIDELGIDKKDIDNTGYTKMLYKK